MDLSSKLKDWTVEYIGEGPLLLVDFSFTPGAKRTLITILVDTLEGVTIDQCALMSRKLAHFIEENVLIEEAYNLEVSSPGLDRPLFELKHFERFVGSTVKVKLHLPINKRRQFKGILKCVLGEDIHILVDGLEQVVVLPFAAIEKANLIGDVRL